MCAALAKTILFASNLKINVVEIVEAVSRMNRAVLELKMEPVKGIVCTIKYAAKEGRIRHIFVILIRLVVELEGVVLLK